MDVDFSKAEVLILTRRFMQNRVFDSKGVADPGVEIKFGPNIKDWPADVCAAGQSGAEGGF